jgi:diguanylate cyclase (GGDEF)-like protein
MTIAPAPAPSSTFEPLSAAAGDELAATALAAAALAAESPHSATLIVVVHPERDNYRILAAEGTGVLRAALSVAVASGNHRLWTDAPVDDTIEHQTRELPEVVRAAADASSVVATHTGVVRVDDRLEGVAIWFETSNGVASVSERRQMLQLLSAAAERDAERADAEAEAAAQAEAELQAASGPSNADANQGRQFDPTDPDLDPLTGLANRDCFDHTLGLYESDHATLVVIDIDHFDSIADEFNAEVADRVLVETVDRLLGECRKSDLVARIGTDTFAILFDDVERSIALKISKRLLDRISQPLLLTPGPTTITATVALSHQFGLVDTEELMESATDALKSGKRSARGRLVIGS